jgi:hypothetical protein
MACRPSAPESESNPARERPYAGCPDQEGSPRETDDHGDPRGSGESPRGWDLARVRERFGADLADAVAAAPVPTSEVCELLRGYLPRAPSPDSATGAEP